MLRSWWSKFSKLGVDDNTPTYLRSVIILSNQLSVIIILVFSLELARNLLMPDMKLFWAAQMLAIISLTTFVPLCNALSYTLLSRVVLALSPLGVYFLLPITAGLAEESDFFWFPYALTPATILAWMLFDMKHERVWAWSIWATYLALLLVIDKIMLSLMSEASLPNVYALFQDQTRYLHYYKLPSIYIWLLTNGMVLSQHYLRDYYMYQSEHYNHQLTHKIAAVQDLVEEISQQSEEIQRNHDQIAKQRDQIAAQHEQLARRNGAILTFQEVLIALTKHSAVQMGDWQIALEQIVTQAAFALNVGRVGIWQYDAQADSITCICMYEQGKISYEYPSIYAHQYPQYFAAIKREELIIAQDAYTHPNTAEFSTDYLPKLNIYSMLDAPYFIDGKLAGVLCIEQQGYPRDWMLEEISFVQSIADIIIIAQKALQRLLDAAHIEEQSKAIEHQNHILTKQKAIIKLINESLEQRIKERTIKLEQQNHQLAEYAFMNAHLLRGPLCRILGLINLIEMDDFKQDKPLFVEKLRVAAQELDDTVWVINQMLEEADLLSREDLENLRQAIRQTLNNESLSK